MISMICVGVIGLCSINAAKLGFLALHEYTNNKEFKPSKLGRKKEADNDEIESLLKDLEQSH